MTWGSASVVRAAAIAASSVAKTSAPSSARPGLRLTTMLRRPGSGLPTSSQVLRPMMIAWPIVTFLKCFRSSGMRQGTLPSLPMTPSSPMATTIASGAARRRSYRDLGRDVRMRVVAFDREVLEAEGEEILRLGIDASAAGACRGSRVELELRLLEVVLVEVRVAERVHEVARRGDRSRARSSS